MHATSKPQLSAVIAAVQLPGVSDIEHAGDIAELGRLLTTLGYRVVGHISQRRSGLGSAAVFGPGKLKELAAFTGGSGEIPSSAPGAGKGGGKAGAKGRGDDDDDDETPPTPEEPEEEADLGPLVPGERPHADVVAVDHEISPRQARNLEKATSAEVLDRTGVIVEIFHRHAHTREARLQVEIARLTYVVPRLRFGVKGTERQQGVGSGESELELDRRRVRDRIAELKGELAHIARDEETRRSRRQSVARVALVGYTNAGKSSLMRALTGSDVLVEDKLFATLGTTVRALQPETTPRILVSDTVGFIKKLPHDLVASFRSTLEEAAEASLLLHVVDASDPDFRTQLRVTRDVLGEIEADKAPSWLVLNKIDAVSDEDRLHLRTEFPDAVQLSAHRPDDVTDLHGRLQAFFEAGFEETELLIPWARGALVGQIHASVRVLEERWVDDGTILRVKAAPTELARLRGLVA
jgi:GTP-binding protein HflX